MPGPRIDFKAIAAAALSSADRLVQQWLPDGRREGHEWKARNPTRDDRSIGSFSVNLVSGVWGDFASGDAGGDLIALYAYIYGLEMKPAALEVAAMVGLSDLTTEPRQPTSRDVVVVKKAPATSAWVPILPVPDDAPPPPVAHITRGKAELSWRYLNAEGKLLGLVARFRTSDGGKEDLPFSYCRHAVTGKQEWRGISFPKPRPLYGLDRLAAAQPGFTVLVVEGEKCADVAHELLTTVVVVSWPGGCRAVEKADWTPLAGRNVVLWPDADSKRHKAPKDATPGQIMPYLSPIEQPGMAAMANIAASLRTLGCKTSILRLPEPGTLPDGWDIADAVQLEGWDEERIRKFMRDNLPAPPSLEIAASNEIPPPEEEPATGPAWKHGLLRVDGGELRACRENVYLILEKHPAWQDVLCLDEFANAIVKRKLPPFPLGKLGEWDSTDDARLGLWLATTKGIRMPVRSLESIAEAVNLVAQSHKHHPVREWLDSLAWDGEPRVDQWLNLYVGATAKMYTTLVGRFFLLGMVARIYSPGCKMDYMPILEGPQGKGKSTVLRVLAGDWFGDALIDMRNKDAFLTTRGKWLCEMAELDSLNRAESTTAKQFLTQQFDDYRAPYDRRNRKWPRYYVFAGTTNQDEYFKDSSGNRRYWPIRVGEILLDDLRLVREQLFAEAVFRFKQGERWHPSREEDLQFFSPEQEEREIGDPWFGIIRDWLAGESAKEFTTADILIGCLRFEIAKIGPARQEATRIGVVMKKLEWTKHRRRTDGNREWYYLRPEPPPIPEPEHGKEPF